MRREKIDLLITAALAILTSAAVFAKLPSAVMVVPGLALLAATGFVWCEALLGPGVLSLERVVVTGALALAVPVLGGLALYAAGVTLTRVAWAGLLAVVVLMGDAVVFLRRRARPGLSPRPAENRSRVSTSSAVCFGAALIVAAGAVGLAHAGSDRQSYPGFAQLWMVADRGAPPRAAVGVTNQQATSQYRVVVLRKGHSPMEWDFVLRQGQSWRRTIMFGTAKGIAAKLYRLPDLGRVYRSVTITDSAVSP